MATLGDLIVRIGADPGNFRDVMAGVSGDVKKLASEFNTFGSQMERLGSSLSNFGSRLTAAVTLPLVGVGVATLKVAGELEQNAVAFKTLLGSAAASQQMLENLKKFALSTPFEFTDLTIATKRLLALGFAAGEVLPTLTAVGNATAALGTGAEGIQRITLALGQMQAKAKVQAEEMRQLAEAGIPAWQILAKTLNTDVAGAMKLVEKRAVDASVAIPALLAGMNQKFNGLMAAQSQTMLGLWSNVKDALTFTLADIGKVLMPFAKSFVTDTLQPALDKAKQLAAAFAELNPKLQNFSLGLAAAAVAAPPLIWALGQIVTGIGGAYKALAGLLPLLMSPTGLVVALGTATVAAVGYGIFKLSELNSKLDETYTKFEQSKTGVNEWAGAWDKAAGDSLTKGLGMTVKITSAVTKSADEIAKAAKKAAAELATAFSTVGLTDFNREIQNLNEAWNLLAARGRINADVLDAYNRKMQELSNLVPGVTQAYLNQGLQQDALAKGWKDLTSGLGEWGLSLDKTNRQMAAVQETMKAWQTGTLETIPSALTDVTQNVDLLNYSMERLGQVFGDIQQIGVDSFKAVKGSILETSDIMAGIGLKATVDLRMEATHLGDEYFRLIELQKIGRASTLDIAGAYGKWQEAEEKVVGISRTLTTEQQQALREVRQAINSISSSLADAIIHWKSFADVGITALEAIGKAILKNVIQHFLDATGIVDKLLAGVGKVLSKIGLDAGAGALSKTAGTTAANAAANAATAKPSVPSPSGASGGSALSTGLGIASLGVDVASGIATGIQLAHIESDVAKIEISTRQCKEQLTGGIQTSLNTYLPNLLHLVDIWGALVNGPLQDIDDMLRYGSIHVTTDMTDLETGGSAYDKQKAENAARNAETGGTPGNADIVDPLTVMSGDVKSIRSLFNRSLQNPEHVIDYQGYANIAAANLRAAGILPTEAHVSTFDERVAALLSSWKETEAAGGQVQGVGARTYNPVADIARTFGVSLKQAMVIFDADAAKQPAEWRAKIDPNIRKFNEGLITSEELLKLQAEALQRDTDTLQDPAHTQAAAQAEALADAQKGLIPAVTDYQRAQRDLATSTRGLQQQVDALQHSFYAGNQSPEAAAALTAQVNGMGSGVALQAGFGRTGDMRGPSADAKNQAVQQYAAQLQDLAKLNDIYKNNAAVQVQQFTSGYLGTAQKYLTEEQNKWMQEFIAKRPDSPEWVAYVNDLFAQLGKSNLMGGGFQYQGQVGASATYMLQREADPPASDPFRDAAMRKLDKRMLEIYSPSQIRSSAAAPIDYAGSLANYAANLNTQWTTVPLPGQRGLPFGANALGAQWNQLALSSRDLSGVNGGSIPSSSSIPFFQSGGGSSQKADVYVTAVNPDGRTIVRGINEGLREIGVKL